MIFVWPYHISITISQVVTVLVRLSISDPWLDSTPSHPSGKGTGVMITTIILTSKFALAVIGTAKFPPPYHQGIVQHALAFQVSN